jgi:hypothetical protein
VKILDTECFRVTMGAMYGFSVHCHFKPDLPFAEVWRAIEEMRGFFRPTGGWLGGQELGTPDPGFLEPPISGERLDERVGLTTLEAPTLDLPMAPHPPTQMAWGGEIRGVVSLRAPVEGTYYREWNGGKPLRVLLLHVSDHFVGHSVSFWTESHVWLSKSPLNPIREFADENLRALAARVETLARRFPEHLTDVPAEFHELKGPFDDEKDRLIQAFACVPKFSPSS